MATSFGTSQSFDTAKAGEDQLHWPVNTFYDGITKAVELYEKSSTHKQFRKLPKWVESGVGEAGQKLLEQLKPTIPVMSYRYLWLYLSLWDGIAGGIGRRLQIEGSISPLFHRGEFSTVCKNEWFLWFADALSEERERTMNYSILSTNLFKIK